MKVRIPTPLRSYTAEQSVIEVSGITVGEVLTKIDRDYPGFRFRIIDEQDGIREHIKIFVNEKPVGDLGAPIRPGETDGTHYHFVTDAAFDQMVEEDAFLEWANVHGNLYGSPRAPVDRALAEAARHRISAADVVDFFRKAQP